MTDQASVIARIEQATSPTEVFEVFESALAEVGADYFAVNFLPRPDQRIEDVCLAWKVPSQWRALYAEEDFIQRDPAVRQSRHTVMPFDWATGSYDPETEPHVREVVERARDFGTHKGLQVPIPSIKGMIGTVWIAGLHFDDREIHTPVLHLLALHAFYRLEQLLGTRLRRTAGLTDRELEVLAWASEGKTAWEIGRILSLSQRTVEWHLCQAGRKLGATNRLQTIALSGDARSMLDARAARLHRAHPQEVSHSGLHSQAPDGWIGSAGWPAAKHRKAASREPVEARLSAKFEWNMLLF
jgi:DNA-binding CsgD family transcriptional regulator